MTDQVGHDGGVRSPVGAGEDGEGAGEDGGGAGEDGGDCRSGPAMTEVIGHDENRSAMTRTDRHCRLDRQSQKDYLYIRKTIGYGAEGICVFYDEWEQ